MRHATVQEVLRRLASGDTRWRARRLEGRRYSSIFVLEPEVDGAGAAQLVLKLYRATQAERRQREFDDLVSVFEALGSEGGVVRPVACYADLGAVVTVRAAGVPLVQRIRAACRYGAGAEDLARTAALCTAAGTWLRRFQAHGAPAMRGKVPAHLGDPAGFLAYVDERLRLLAGSHPGIEPALRSRLLAHTAAVLHALPPSRFADVTWSHSDFGPHNVLVEGTSLTVLDFELAPQHPAFDAAYFVESILHQSGPLVDASRLRRVMRAFLAGSGVAPEDPLFGLFRLRHLLCTFVSESRRSGPARLRSWPGLLGLRRRLESVSIAMSERARARSAGAPQGPAVPHPAA